MSIHRTGCIVWDIAVKKMTEATGEIKELKI